MQESEIYQQVVAEISGALKIEPSRIQSESLLVGDLGAESLDLVDLTFRFEKAFDIEIPEGQLFEGSNPTPDKLTINDIVQYLGERLG